MTTIVRQIVAVVQPDTVSWYVTEGDDEAHQLAQVVNNGLSVRDVIGLGAMFVEALGVGGKTRKVTSPPRAIGPAPGEQQTTAKPKGKTASGKRRQRSADKLPRKTWGLSAAQVLDHLREYPDSTTGEIVTRLLPDDVRDPRASKIVNNYLWRLQQEGQVEYGQKPGHDGYPLRTARVVGAPQRETPQQEMPELAS